MLARIAAFELRYQLRSPLFAVGFALFFLLPFGSVASDNVHIGSGGNVHLNSPYALAQTVAIMNVFALFVVTAFVANVVIRDDETGFAPLVRTTRVSKRDYLVGRFVGALTVAFGVTLAVPLGVWVGSCMPWVDAETLGPFVPGHYLYAAFVLSLPTVALMAAAFFAVATLTRSLVWTFIGAAASLVLFLATRLMLRDPAWDAVSAWTDPFGIGALDLATRYWTAAERNSLMPALAGTLLGNRLLWLAIGAALFAAAYAVFRFEARPGSLTRRRGRGAAADPQGDAPGTPGDPPTAARQTASRRILPGGPHPQLPVSEPTGVPARRGSMWAQFAALARFDAAFVVRSPAFVVLLFLGLGNSLGSLVGTVEGRGVDYLPVTRAVVDALQNSFTLFPLLIAVFYGGELVWRDRERRMHEIVDATPAPDWAFVLPKALAVAGVLLASYVVALLGSMAFQAAHGYFDFELGKYLLWFLLPGLASTWLPGVLSVFVQAVVPNKFVGWGVMVVYIVAGIALASLGFEHVLYNYGDTPPVPLSDMNGAGRFWIGRVWAQAYWLAFAAILLVVTHALWRRGADTALRPRLARLPWRLRGATGVALGVAVLAWLASGAWVFYNTNVLNRYETRDESEARLAELEKALLPFETVPQPTITHVHLEVALYPRQTRAETRGYYLMENRSGQALTEVHVQWNPDLQLRRLDVAGGRVEREWERFGYRIIRLAQPLQPGEQARLDFETVLEQRGFVNRRPLTSVVANGSFISNFDVTPNLGIRREGLLQDRAKRREHGLAPELRPARLEDAHARAHHYLRHDSDWVTAEIALSTDADQTPVAPGYTISDTTAGGRRTVVTRTEAPIQNFFSLQSAQYAVAQDTWTGPGAAPVQLAVYYHPAHSRNVRRMLDAMKASLGVFSARFTPFQFRQMRIVEFPQYGTFAQSFANTVPYSESIGFVQDFRDEQADEKIDLVTYVTAHELAHQWWAHQVIGADQQGMTLLSESLAQYSALLVMEQLYGKEQLRKFLRLELDDYLRSRGREVIEELPLARVEDQGYIHYHKGALAMWALKEEIGEETVNRALRRLLAAYAFKPAPYPSSTDFLTALRQEAGPAHEGLIADLFEKITVLDLQAHDARVTQQPDGRYEVRFTVEARKLYADGTGAQTEAPLDESFVVGAFATEPGTRGYGRDSVLALERRSLTSGSQEIALVLDRAPAFVGIDPFNTRIDRNSADNLTSVEGP